MPIRISRRGDRAVIPLRSAAMLCAVTLAGCQSYQAAPLDFDAHRNAFENRLTDLEPIEAFASRLHQQDSTAPQKFDLSDGLSPSEAEAFALFYNADLRLARAEANIALANSETAGLWDDPEFGFDGAEIYSPSSPFQFGLVLSLTLPISGRLEVEKARAGAAHAAKLQHLVDAEWNIRSQVRHAWARWVTAELRVQQVRLAADQTRAIDGLTQQLVSAGELNRIEGRLFHIDWIDRNSTLMQAEFESARAKANLLGLLGLPPFSPVELVLEFPDINTPSPDDPTDRLIRCNTLLAARRAEYQVAEESLRLEVRKQFPDIKIGSGYGSEERDDRLLLGVAVPIPILNANKAGIAEARAQRDQSRAIAETTYEELVRQLEVALLEQTNARSQRILFETKLIPLLDQQLSEVERIAELGDVDALLLHETVTRQFEARIRLLELRLTELRAEIAVHQLLGPDQPGTPAPIEQTSTPSEQHTAAADDHSTAGDTQ